MNGEQSRACLSGAGKRACVALFVLLSASPAYGQERIGLTQNPLAGSQVFGSTGCVKCHSVNGLGGTIGPELGRIARRRSFYDLAATMWNHLPIMGQQMKALGIERTVMDEREAVRRAMWMWASGCSWIRSVLCATRLACTVALWGPAWTIWVSTDRPSWSLLRCGIMGPAWRH